MNDQLDKIFLKNVKYILTTNNIDDMPADDINEIVVVGRSNVGKSTFINTISNNNKLAKKSSNPGKTKAISLFDVNGKFRLVDIPGYGFANVNRSQKIWFQKMMDNYFDNRKNISLIILLLDIRRGLTSDDLVMLEYLKDKGLNYKIIGTKIDKANQKERNQFLKNLKLNNLSEDIISYSAKTKLNLSKVIDLFNSYF